MLGRKPKVVLNSHIDTVPPYIPLTENEGHFYGRGTCDAKGSIAAQITAVLGLELKPGDVSLLYVVGEEVNHAGIIKANELNIQTDHFIVGEPTESRLAKGHKGMIRLEIVCKGKAAHSGYPDKGISALSSLIDILHELEHASWPVHAQLGPTTFNIGTVHGGRAMNIVPEHAEAALSLRCSTGTEQVINEIIMPILRKKRVAHVEFTFSHVAEPIHCDDSLAPELGVDTFVAAYFTDIPHFHGSHKKYLIGPGSILVAHSNDEFLNKKEFEAHIQLYQTLVKRLLNE